MAISVADVRALFTKTLIDVYQERIKPTQFLGSFFPSTTSPTKTVSIEVERGFEKVAVDVVRGTEGNRNTFSRSTEKIFEPPLWREYFDATQLDLYDRVLGSQGNANKPLFTALMQSVSDRLALLQDKIERAKEVQRAQVLDNGVVTIVQGTNINFARKAASIVDLAAPPSGYGYTTGLWTTGATDVFKQLEAACNFMRTVGKSGDGTYNLICGSGALGALLTNTTFLTRQNLFSMALDQVTGPQRGALGMTFHGTLTAGSYKVQLWAYPQFYDNASGVSTPYIAENKAILIPTKPRFVTAHAAVPQLIGEPGQTPTQGEYVVGDFIDPRKAVHEFDIQSAAIAIPIAVDQIVTLTVKAAA